MIDEELIPDPRGSYMISLEDAAYQARIAACAVGAVMLVIGFFGGCIVAHRPALHTPAPPIVRCGNKLCCCDNCTCTHCTCGVLASPMPKEVE